MGGTRRGTRRGTPPQRRAAPAAKKGGSLPSLPAPLAWFGSAGLGRKTRTTTAKNGRGDGTPPPAVLGTPPPLSASRCPCHGACHGACHGTGHGAGAPLDSNLGGGQADGGPDREAVNRPARRRRGGRALGSCCNNSRRSAAVSNPPAARKSSRLPAVIACSSRAISWRISGSALVGPAGSAAPWPSPSWVQRFRTGAARSAASAPVPTATMCTAKVRARSAAHNGAWATPHARSSLSVVCPGSTHTNVAICSSTAIGSLNAK